MIVAENLYKRYYLYDSPWAKVREMLGLARAGEKRREFWALKDVSLRVGRGRTLGVIGPNGAGKSTLLKMVTGIARPTGGSIRVEGRVAALLELGTGFHPEFTGRQNIHINAKMLGLTDAEIRAREEEIAAFAEIGRFIDQPLRTYSTGMAMRLGFATGVAAQPDVFIIDEVLAVGDAYFSQKCHRKLEDIRARGTTILIVSHDMNAIVRLCDEVILLNEGSVEAQGEPRAIIEYYTQLIAGRSQTLVEAPAVGRKRAVIGASGAADMMEDGPARRYGSREALITGIEMRAAGREAAGDVFMSGGDVTVRLRALFLAPVENPTIGLLIRDRVGYDIFGTNTVWMRQATGRFTAGEQADFEFSFALNLAPGLFTVTAAIHRDETHLEKCFDWIDRAFSFRVVDGADFRCYGAARLSPRLAIARGEGGPEDTLRTVAAMFDGAPAALAMDEVASPWLLAGWHTPELGRDGRVMRWTAEEALFVLGGAGGRVTLDCQAAGRESSIELTLYELDRPLGAKRLEPEAAMLLSWDIPPSLEIEAGGVPRVFRLTVSPGMGGEPGAGDPRRLGVLVFGISGE